MAKATVKHVRVTISLPQPLLEQLNAHIAERFGKGGRALSMVVREALKDYLEGKPR